MNRVAVASSSSSVSSVASSVASSASSVATVGGTEGLMTTTIAALPADDSNVRTTSNVSVYGIDVKAAGSDMIVDRADLKYQLLLASSAQNPSNFITGISAYDGNTLLVSKTLTSADVNKDSSSRYHVIISGIGFKVAKDATKTLTFKINTNSISSSDSARVVTVKGYAGNTNNIRAYDTLGLQSYTDMTGKQTKTFTFNSSGSSTLTVSGNTSATPVSTTNKVNSSDGVQNLVMQAVNFKSTTGDPKSQQLRLLLKQQVQQVCSYNT